VRPKTRQETREALDALYDRRHLEWSAASTTDEQDALWKKLDAVSQLRKKFMWTRLADFQMPPPSPREFCFAFYLYFRSHTDPLLAAQPGVQHARVSVQTAPARRIYTAKIPSGHPYDYKPRRASGLTSTTGDVDDPVAKAFYNYAK
jgi:hypothetical protein